MSHPYVECGWSAIQRERRDELRSDVTCWCPNGGQRVASEAQVRCGVDAMQAHCAVNRISTLYTHISTRQGVVLW